MRDERIEVKNQKAENHWNSISSKANLLPRLLDSSNLR